MTVKSVPVPETLEEAMCPQWLTAALQIRFPTLRVHTVAPGPVVERISTNARFRIEASGVTGDAPMPNLCLKGYFGKVGRAARFIGEPEAYFYRDVAASTGVRTLRAVYADVDPISRHGVVITEDVVAHGGHFLDGNSDFTPDQAAETLTEFARLHASTWLDARYNDVSWLAPRLSRSIQAWGMPATVEKIARNFDGPNGQGVPPELRDAERLAESYRQFSGHVGSDTASAAWCVIHGDAHVGNLFVDSSGRPSLLDWQLVQRGMWYIDVGYLIASALTVEDRRRSEYDLLRHYLEQLASLGIPPPRWQQARLMFTRGMMHGFFLWAITSMVEPAVIAVLLQRLATAVADHGVGRVAVKL